MADKTIVGVQASSLRDFLQTPDSLCETLKRLFAMGYRFVQMQWWNPQLEPEFVAQAVRDSGLVCIGTQDFYENVRADFARILRLNELCESRCVCISRIPAPALSRSRVLDFAQEILPMAQELQARGMTLAFHPHAREWAPVDENNPDFTFVDLLLENTPDNVTLGLDLYHTGHAGLRAEDILHRFAGRIDFAHFKDYIIRKDGTEALVPVGQGQTDWTDAVHACMETRVPWVLTEQERWEKDAFICMQESLAFMQAQGFPTE